MHVAEAGAGEPLLLLHGFPQHWWAWRKMLPGLAEHYRVICPDLRGAGWTDAPAEGYTSDQLLADVVALLDVLQIPRTHVIGYDYGGIVGYRLCLKHPERVGRFMSIATPHPYPALHPRVLLYLWRIWPMFAIATPGLGPRLLRFGWLPRWLMTSDTRDRSVWTPKDIDLFVARLRDPARAQAGSTLYRSFILAEAKRSGAGMYRGTRLPTPTPTLSLYGTVLYERADATGHPEILSGYEGFTDDFTMERIPGVGFYMAEEQPDRVVERALEFLGAPEHGGRRQLG